MIADDSAASPVPKPGTWIRTDRVAEPAWAQVDVPLFPRTGRCSVQSCAETGALAVLRVNGHGRAKHWQCYCDGHAAERGVRRSGDGLEWTPEFLQHPPPAMAKSPGG